MKLTKSTEGGEMPTTTQINIFDSDAILVFLKGAILLILIFYAIFSLIIIKQVDLMSKTLITQISPVLKFITFIHAFFAMGLILLVWGIL